MAEVFTGISTNPNLTTHTQPLRYTHTTENVCVWICIHAFVRLLDLAMEGFRSMDSVHLSALRWI